MQFLVELIPNFHMWFVLGLILCALVMYAKESFSMEVTSAVVLSVLLLFFYLVPMTNGAGVMIVDAEALLHGFANPALITVIALLIVGQAVVQTGALNEIANLIARVSRNNAVISIFLCLIVVMVTSAILNNTPVVVIFIPILAALAKKLDMSVSRVMIPLSFVAILGGMTTLVGSSTNLLVSGALEDMGHAPLGFFEFTLIGSMLAGVGFIYVWLIAPKLLIDRASLARSMVSGDGEERQFIAQIEIDRESEYRGKHIEKDHFPGFTNIDVRMVQRGEHAFLPPFDESMELRPRDIVIVAATRKDITELVSKQPEALLHSSDDSIEKRNTEAEILESGITLAEVVITPASRMIGRNLEEIGFHHHYHSLVLGIQRQERIIRSRVSEIRLAAGDVLLVMGKPKDILLLQESSDLLLLEWSTEDIHSGRKAKQAGIILVGVVAPAALEWLPIVVTAFSGATAAIILGCLNLRQAIRSIDSQVVLIVATSLALGVAMQKTGGALFLASQLVDLLSGLEAVAVMSVLFLAMVIVTNILSNNASAVLFTPIAVNLAQQLNAPISMFVFAVIFACNCSFLTPIGYQTNLLVMGPGHYKFADFMRGGLPLAILIWITYTAIAYFMFIA